MLTRDDRHDFPRGGTLRVGIMYLCTNLKGKHGAPRKPKYVLDCVIDGKYYEPTIELYYNKDRARRLAEYVCRIERLEMVISK